MLVSHRPLIAEARVRSQVGPCEICGGQSVTATVSLPVPHSVFPCQYHSTNDPHSSSTTWCYYKDNQTKAVNFPKFSALSEFGERWIEEKLHLLFKGVNVIYIYIIFYASRYWLCVSFTLAQFLATSVRHDSNTSFKCGYLTEGVVVFLSPSRQMRCYYIKVSPRPLPSSPFQFAIHRSLSLGATNILADSVLG